MITRIMCVGPGRINEAVATISFDYQIVPQCDRTIIISPYSQLQFQELFSDFDLNITDFTFLDDEYFGKHYDLSRWTHNNWYKQQAFKLCALDHVDSEYFLIQDCDLILLKPYSMIVSGNLNFKAEDLWNEYQHLYGTMIEKILGLSRKHPVSLVNELMPYTKQDWSELKSYMEQRHGCNFLDAIANTQALDHTSWFSEYELLGIWKTNQTGWQYFSNPSQPKVETWEEFFAIDWSQYHSVKFHAPPLKNMDINQAKHVIKFLRGVAKS
jgi:hypothetical protein